ncbi:MAG: septal ring factor EnvC (AmiA/AmiB activator) [Paraglaciecola sp.]|jgi:septal ring factor EnvC (AmiA/AmiB activator)
MPCLLFNQARISSVYLRILFVFVLSLSLSSLNTTTALAQQSDDLEAIQQQIKNKTKQIELQLAEAKKLEATLRKAELEIAKTAKALNSTEQGLTNNTQQRQLLKQQQQALQKKLNLQQDALAKQLRSAFMTGNYDYAKMLLNQQDAAKFERTISYYQYLNKARKSQIDEFRLLVKELQQVNQDLVAKQQQLEQLQTTQQSQKDTLSKQQSSRKVTLSAIQKAIQSDAAKVEQLQINEQNLLRAVQEAQRLAQNKPTTLEGLLEYKGQLLLPTKGKVRRLFGDRRQGQVRWKGILIDSKGGSSVVAIHHAKVLYADWLRGFGLVTVLDHGDGYMSLYGHNQALLRQAGDTVSAGEVIALVGQSGGQNVPSLYFEIRHKGKPVNPTNWLKL